jgi:hypothetical protein
MSSVIAEYEVELSSLNLSEMQKECVMRMLSSTLSTFEKGGAKGVGSGEFGSTFSKGGKGGAGRPSKSKKVVETGGETDVFEQLLSMGLEDPPLVKEDSVATLVVAPEGLLAPPFPKVEKSEKLAATNAKSAEKAAKAAEKQAAKDAKEAEKAAAKDAKEAEKAAAIKAKEDAKQAVIDAKAAKEAEKAAAIKAKEDAKAAKEAEKAAAIKAKEDAKLAKEAEKEAKAAAKADKEAAKLAKEAAKAEKEAANPPLKKVEPKTADEPAAEESKAATNAEQEGSKGTGEALPVAPSALNLGSPAVRVKKFSFEGVKYLKDTAGTIYDLASQDRIGVWNEEEKKIVFDAKGEAEEEDECSEEEYHF